MVFGINLENSGAGASETAHVVEGERCDAEAIVFEVKLDGVLAGGEGVGAFPLDAFEVD